ncbi:MAG: O-antigen ligase family protein [Flavobacteriales bacterium]|nr:O-antigen ligase family protein [Flavobacteriales bacterium]
MKRRDTIHLWLTIVLAFLMPVYQKWVPMVMVLIAVNWLAGGKRAFRFSTKPNIGALICMAVFYIIHVLGMMWTSNTGFGTFDLQVKLPMLLFPIIYLSFDFFSREDLHKVFWGFIFGSLVAICIGIGNAVFVYNTGESPMLDFYSEKISPVLHIGYFAMYLNMALVLTLYMILASEKRFYTVKNATLILLSMIFAIAIFLSTSRNQFAVMALIILLLFIYGVVRYRKWLIGVLALLVVWIGISFMFKDIGARESDVHGFQEVADLVKNEGKVDKKAFESTSVRVLIWNSAWTLIKENPILGVGTGDIKDELIRLYTENQYEVLIEKRYNSHNQYLQSWAALGPFALLSLLGSLGFGMWVSFKNNNFVYGLFTLIMGVACVTESSLEVQAGVVFYAFFLSLFAIGTQNGAFYNSYETDTEFD